ncbi:MAG: ribokinase [Roseibium sp.]|nr:ribokinase [Roseibium sp.]
MITVFGSINLDLVVSVPRLPGPGETVSGPDHQSFAGGKGANQALSARRAGADVAMVGAVGNDAFADLALANLRLSGVDLSGVRALDGATGLALIGVEDSGENQIIVASGANARVDAEWLDGRLTPGAWLLVQGEVRVDQIETAMTAARRAGTKVFFNPAPVPGSSLKALLDLTDVLVVNEGEARDVAEALDLPADPEAFAAAFAAKDRIAVVTLGGAGAVACSRERTIRCRPPAIDVVDTTGAGDAFCGALAAALDAGLNLDLGVRRAVAAGALACQVTGAQSSAPDAKAISDMAGNVRIV